MMMLEICERYHWDYWTYLKQPMWLLTMIVDKMNIDAKKQKQNEIANKNK